MQYIQLRQSFKDFTIFSLSDIRQVEPGFHRRRLNEWQSKGYVKKVIKEYYIFSDKYIDDSVLFEISNRIYKPSYVSLETALSHYQLIPESVYSTTSISTRRTYGFHTDLGDFRYRTIKPDNFWGYEIIPYEKSVYKMAELEKAVLDFLYLNRHLRSNSDFESLRFNEEMFFQRINLDKLKVYSHKFAQNTLIKRLDRFLTHLSSQREKNNA